VNDTQASGKAPSAPAAVRKLAVWLDGVTGPIGVLTGTIGDGFHVTFAYDPAYLHQDGAVPLSARLPLRGDPYADAEARGFFENLLPEGERRRREAQASRLDTSDIAGLLEKLGRECAGAVSVLPQGAPPAKAPGQLSQDYDPLTPSQLESLITEVASGRSPGERVRFSLAGVQRKLALARDPVSGTFLLPRDGAPTTWLVKVEPPDSDYRGIVANEALCLSVLRRLGLPVVHAERQMIGRLPVLLVARYDRTMRDGLVMRRHQEDAAQVLGVPPELKYETDAEQAGIPADQSGFAGLLGRVAGVTRAPVDARAVLVRAAHANWLLGNCDAHLKNFAVLHGSARVGTLRAGGRLGHGFDLAPLYDVVCVGAYPEADQRLAMRIGRAEQWDDVGRDDWLHLAQQMFPGRRVAASVLAKQIEWLRDYAATVLPAIDAAVADGVATREEAKPVRDVVGARIRHLNRTLRWSLPADTDAPVRQGGGWLMS